MKENVASATTARKLGYQTEKAYQWLVYSKRSNASTMDREYDAAIQMTTPLLAAAPSTSRRMELYVDTADLPNFFRKPYGPTGYGTI